MPISCGGLAGLRAVGRLTYRGRHCRRLRAARNETGAPRGDKSAAAGPECL